MLYFHCTPRYLIANEPLLFFLLEVYQWNTIICFFSLLLLLLHCTSCINILLDFQHFTVEFFSVFICKWHSFTCCCNCVVASVVRFSLQFVQPIALPLFIWSLVLPLKWTFAFAIQFQLNLFRWFSVLCVRTQRVRFAKIFLDNSISWTTETIFSNRMEKRRNSGTDFNVIVSQ